MIVGLLKVLVMYIVTGGVGRVIVGVGRVIIGLVLVGLL